MRKVVHTSHSRIARENGPTRIAKIEGFEDDVYYGVHGGIADFYNYKASPGEKEHAATLDHIVTAVAS